MVFAETVGTLILELQPRAGIIFLLELKQIASVLMVVQTRKLKGKMAERLNKCPKCYALEPEVLVIHNPETTDLNAKPTLKCWDCLHTWED